MTQCRPWFRYTHIVMNSCTGIRRVILERYKSIAACDVAIGPLTFLVGPNGAGKSNFIDAMRFCRDALRTPLDQVFAQRATNLYNIAHRSPKGSLTFGMRFEFALSDEDTGFYAFEIGPQSPRGFEVRKESCVIVGRDKQTRYSFTIEAGRRTGGPSATTLPVPNANRLFLVNASGLPEFQPVYDLLSNMEFSENMAPGKTYSATIDQPSLASRFDLIAARRAAFRQTVPGDGTAVPRRL